MSIFRVEKNKNYTVMSNHHLRDKKLSLKAIGLLSLILSLPDNWNYSQAGLAAICKDGEDSIRNGLKELEQYGYLVRERERDENGKMKRMVYHIYEVPDGSEKPQEASEKNRSPRSSNALKAHTAAHTNRQSTEKGVEMSVVETPNLGNPIKANYKQIRIKQSIKDKQNIEQKINPSTTLSKEMIDGQVAHGTNKTRDVLRSLIRQKVGYDLFLFKHQNIESKLNQGLITIDQYDHAISENNLKTLDQIIEYVLDVLTSLNNDPIKIGNELIDREVVKDKLLGCSVHDMKMVITALNTNPSIKNPKKYAISMLYNA